MFYYCEAIQSPTMNSSQLTEWVEDLRQAWEHGDAGRAAALFAEDAVYHSHPFKVPLHGRGAIERHWSEATANQKSLTVRMGAPVLDGDRAAVEWWTNLTEGGGDSTDCGVLVLTFDGDVCKSLREYWNLADGHVAPQAGWGQ